MSEWIDIKDQEPPSFFDVWVLNGKSKRKAYYDRPNRRWVKIFKDDPCKDWDCFYQVTHWKQIRNYTFEDQMKEENEA